MTLKRERVPYLRLASGDALTLEASGPLVLELRLRPILERSQGTLTLRCERDGAFESTKTLSVRRAALKVPGGKTPKRPIVAQVAVPAGEHTYACRAEGDAAGVLVVLARAKKLKQALAMGEEVERVAPPPPEEPPASAPGVAAAASTPPRAAGTVAAAKPTDDQASGAETPPPAASESASAAAEAAAPQPVTESAAALPPPEGPPALLAEGPPKRTFLMPLTATDMADSDVALLQDQLTAQLGRLDNAQVITPAEVQEILTHEAQKQRLGCESDTVCLAELGQSANADLLVSGKAGKIGDVFMLGLTVVEPKSGTVVGRSTVTAAGVEGLMSELAPAVAQAFGASAGSRVASFSLEIPEGGIKVAVMPLRSQGLEENVGNNLTQIVALELKNLPGFSVISQDEIAAMLQLESNKQQVGCDDASCFAEIGGALGVDYLVIGTVGRLGDTFLVGLKLINTRAANVVNRINESFKGRESDLLRAARFAVFQLVGAKLETPGALAVRVTPDEPFRLELDGALVADMKELKSVAPGRHDLRIDAEGYYGQYLETYVEPGLSNTVALELSAIPRPWFTHWWVWAAGTGVVAGGVAAAVYFLGGDSGTSFGAVDVQLQKGLTHVP